MICPKCGMEFKDGIVNCTDCGTALVEDLKKTKEELVPLLSLPSDYARRMGAYFSYSNIEVQIVPNQDVEAEHILMVKPSQKELAAKHASVFLSQEPITQEEEGIEKDDSDHFFYAGGTSDSSVHSQKTAQERYNEAMSTAFTFGGCAAALVLILLDQFVFHYFLPSGSLITNIIFIGITGAMVFGCLKYFSISKKLQKEAAEESKLQVNIRTWLKDKMIGQEINSLMAERLGSQFEELLIEREQYLIGILRNQFPDANIALLESEAEKFLSELDAQTEQEDSAQE